MHREQRVAPGNQVTRRPATQICCATGGFGIGIEIDGGPADIHTGCWRHRPVVIRLSILVRWSCFVLGSFLVFVVDTASAVG